MKNVSKIIFFLLCSCQPVLRTVTGIKQIEKYSDSDIRNIALQYEIDTGNLYALEAENYLNFINTIDTSKFKQAKHDLLQPLQILYFDTNGVIKFHLINCNVGGFPNLKWNRFGYFDKHELSMPESYLPYNQLTIESLIPYLQPLSLSTHTQENTDGYLVVFWDAFMGRQTEVFLENAHAYLAAFPSQAELFFVNNDNLFSFIEQHQNL